MLAVFVEVALDAAKVSPCAATGVADAFGREDERKRSSEKYAPAPRTTTVRKSNKYFFIVCGDSLPAPFFAKATKGCFVVTDNKTKNPCAQAESLNTCSATAEHGLLLGDIPFLTTPPRP